MDDPRIGFIGAGTLGKALAMSLASQGYRVAAVSSRTHLSAVELADLVARCQVVAGPQEVADLCDLVFITTPDSAIVKVASQVKWRPGQGVVHCSGADSLDVLESAARLGAHTGSFHPFQTFACVRTPSEATARLKAAAIAVEGRGWLVTFLERVATRLGRRTIHVAPQDRAIYHAAAVMSCGHLVGLLSGVSHLWEAIGVSPEDALPMVMPLVEATLGNVGHAGIAASLTGPVARGDATTLKVHLEALEARLPRLVHLYCTLARECLSLVHENLTPRTLGEIEQLLDAYETGHGAVDEVGRVGRTC